MRNIIREPLSKSELREVFAACPPGPLLPPKSDARWQECAAKPVTQKLLSEILPRAISEAQQPLPALSAELYGEYHRSGNRLKFENVYFERRRRLARAVFCALFTPDAQKWMPIVLRQWDDIFDEESWALPAHVTDPSGRDANTIDLFAAETANLMGELLNVFGAEAGQERHSKIHDRLRQQFFVNYLEHPERRRWSEMTHNWNAVCHQGVLGAALAIEEDADLLARLFATAAPCLEKFLSGFTADGGCSEGPGYWNYGFGWFAVLNEQLEARTRGALSLFADDRSIDEIARFGRRTILSPHCVVCFADGVPNKLPRPSLLKYLGERLNDAGNQSEAQAGYNATLQNAPRLDEERFDVFYLLRMVLCAPAAAPQPLPHTQPQNRETVYLPDLAVWISHGCDQHGTRWALAAKAGNNAEHHNHNDCGSFMLVLNGQPILDEIGAPQYERDFFSARRYEFLAARTLGHSLPIINNCEQQAGAQFAASVIKAEFGAHHDEFSLDLTACYPAEARCTRYIRTFRVQREPFEIEIGDEFETQAEVPIECALMTHAEVQHHNGSLLLSSENQSLQIKISEDEARFERYEEPTYMKRGTTEPSTIHRLVFVPAIHEHTARLTLRLKAATGSHT
ncbi:MAG: hypothetical protein JWN98_624 [Abditibacteriota bacterium]|nr:hypothetical protein [Abditibacteriota bacterium]